MTALCPFCKTQSPTHFSIGDLNQGTTEKVFQYYRCTSCRLIFLFPVPADLGSYYKATYPAYRMPSSQELDAKAVQERYKLETVRKFVARGRLLEIGPSYGAFAYLAKKAGYEVDAIEMDARCCAYLSEVVGINAINSNDIAVSLEKMIPYDVIALWHVIEHLTKPWDILKSISEKILPGGILVIAAPNTSAFQFKVFGRFWVHVDTPRHLQLIPMQVLTKHMESLGMRLVMATTNDEASKVFSTFDWWLASLRNFLKKKAAGLADEQKTASKQDDAVNGSYKDLSSLTKNLVRSLIRLGKTLIAGTLHIFFLLILKPIERREGLGCAYTLVFRKK